MNAAALVTALASFAFLAILVGRLRGEDDQAARDALLREYKRRRAAMA